MDKVEEYELSLIEEDGQCKIEDPEDSVVLSEILSPNYISRDKLNESYNSGEEEKSEN